MGSADLSTDLEVSFLAPAASVRSADADSSNRDAPSRQRQPRKIRMEPNDSVERSSAEEKPSGSFVEPGKEGEWAKQNDEKTDNEPLQDVAAEPSILADAAGHQLDHLA